MESPDVVDTSDVEERDVLSFPEDIESWATSASTPLRKSVRANLASPQSAIAEKNSQQRPSSLTTLIARQNRLSDHEAESPSPRKRVKV